MDPLCIIISTSIYCIRWMVSMAQQSHKSCFNLKSISYTDTLSRLDFSTNLPQLAFSMCQVNIMLWFLKANGASHVPSSKMICTHNNALHNMCGVHSLQYTGAFGDTFFVISLVDLIAQVMWVHTHIWYIFYIYLAGNGQPTHLTAPLLLSGRCQEIN